ncbi:hypothetical protein HYV71_04985 [Candidatus Uhrbacteria bacterium]|nr:hypothetical protein [Candidatus Uhrbacteria bacterium]
MQDILKNNIARIALIVIGCIVGIWGGAQLLGDLNFGRNEETRGSIEQIREIAKKSAVAFVPFENKSLGFRMQYPKNWETGTQDGLPYFKTEEKQATLTVVYSFDVLTRDLTADEFFPEVRDAIFEFYRTENIPVSTVKEGPTLMGGAPAYEWEIEYVREGKPYVATQVWTIKDKKAHYLIFTSLADESRGAFYPIFLKMVKTFELF